MAEDKQCERCEKLYSEIMNSFRVAVDRMRDIAAQGKGQEYEAENNPLYNRYFGCAIAMDTMLKEYFPERVVKAPEAEAAAEEEVPADATRN